MRLECSEGQGRAHWGVKVDGEGSDGLKYDRDEFCVGCNGFMGAVRWLDRTQWGVKEMVGSLGA